MRTLKTTKKETLLKKIEKLDLRKNTNVYQFLTALANGCKRLDTVWSSGGSWKHSSLYDVTYEVEMMLIKLGIKYQVSNDAPRGGKTGKHIEILTKVK